VFDLLILTAANAAQAKGYRAQVGPLEGKLAQRIVVYPDPGGKRVGSLGATVNALRKVGKISADARVLICHGGGDARRTPAYAALGKAMVPMPDGRPILAHIVELMDQLPQRAGVLVCCGDVIPRVPPAEVAFAEAGVTGVAYWDGAWQARRHGVYMVQSAECRVNRVRGFLQKPEVKRGKFLIDTGIMFIDWETAGRMRKLPVKGDIYVEFPAMLLKGFAKFSVAVASECDFFHIGSSRELLKLLGKKGRLVDGCQAAIERLDGDNLVTNVPVEHAPVKLGKGECLTCLPVGEDEWVDIQYHIDDNFKGDGKWEQYRMGELMKQVEHRRLLGVRGILVERPLRIDLAGGWSDTPPICNEMGGSVLNMAVTLDGELPVKAAVNRIAAKEVRVQSVDLGKSGVLTKREEIYGEKDPHDWCALVKSALAVVGYEFEEGGLDIRISADVPQGSGLGTSSILGSAVVEALLRVRGREDVTWQEVARLTLALEQEMNTGGGWQDQMGALVPGVKLVETKPGKVQEITVKSLPRKAAAEFVKFLDSRSLLYFTGRKRMARNILRGVLDFYAQNPCDIAHEIVRRLKRDAEQAFKALKRGDWEAFCAAVNGYWQSKKALDPGSTNPLVESIIARVAPWTAAVTLCGAGGGGFMFIIAESEVARDKIRQVLERFPPVAAGKCYRMRVEG